MILIGLSFFASNGGVKGMLCCQGLDSVDGGLAQGLLRRFVGFVDVRS